VQYLCLRRLCTAETVMFSLCPVVQMSRVNTNSSAAGASPLHTCSGGTTIWPRAVFNSCGSDPKTDSSLSQMVFIACQHIDARYWYSNSVCPSVCLSVMFRYQTNHSSFISIKHLHEIPTGSPCGGAKYRWGIKISQFSTNKSLYLANDTRYRVVTMEGE